MSLALEVLPDVDERTLASALFRNDRDYFRAGAIAERLGACCLQYQPGLAHSSAGAIVEGGAAAALLLPEIVDRLQAVGAQTLRLYLPGDVRVQGLEAAGLQRTLEPALAISASAPRPMGHRPVLIRRAGPMDDALKAGLLASDGKLPDGKAADPAEYVALERRKIDAGYMDGFLLLCDGEPAATFCLSCEGPVLRLKNLFVHPAWRGRGMVEALMAFAMDEAERLGFAAVGVFALQDSAGHRVYRRIGMSEVGVQTEYAAPLTAFIEWIAA